jgi:hypothetical protein
VMTDITIPPEAVEAARRAFTEALLSEPLEDPIATALRAGIAAWPGMWHIRAVDFEGKVILPLPTENTND